MAWASCYSADFRAISQVGAATGTTVAENRRLAEGFTGTSGWVTSGTACIETGRPSLTLDLNSVAGNFQVAKMATAPRYIGAMFHFRISTITAANVAFCTMTATTAAESCRLRVNQTTGVLAYTLNNGTNWNNTSTTLAAQTSYRFEVFVDYGVSTNDHVLKVRMGTLTTPLVEVINVTGGAATSTAVDPTFGSALSAAGVVLSYADCVTYNDVAQYASVDNLRVLGLEPTADGTHAPGVGTFTNSAGAAIAAGTTNAYTFIDDAPAGVPSLSDFVRQTGTASTGYIEFQFRTYPVIGYAAPVLVNLAAAVHPIAAATANAAQFRLVSGANVSAEAAIDASVAADTLEYRQHVYPTEPGGAAWTVAKGTAPLRARFGYATDVSPVPALDAIMAFVVAPVTQILGTASATSATPATAAGTVTARTLISGTATSTSATSATSAGAATHHQYLGTATATSATSATAAGTRTVKGTATATSATSAAATGKRTVKATSTATSATSATATGVATHHAYAGSATSTSASSATGAGSVGARTVVNGTASGTSTTTAPGGRLTTSSLQTTATLTTGGSGYNAVGTASNHTLTGTATGTSASSATATGTKSSHQYLGTVTSTSASSATATGTRANHPYAGTATATSTTSASAVGVASKHAVPGTATSTSASSATATGTKTRHQYLGTAAATSITAATATGTRTGNQKLGTAASTSTTSASAAGAKSNHTALGTAAATSTTSASATGLRSRHLYIGTAAATSATPATAAGTYSAKQLTGTATATSATSASAHGGIPSPYVLVTGYASAVGRKTILTGRPAHTGGKARTLVGGSGLIEHDEHTDLGGV